MGQRCLSVFTLFQFTMKAWFQKVSVVRSTTLPAGFAATLTEGGAPKGRREWFFTSEIIFQ
jgi:hypothetical protein